MCYGVIHILRQRPEGQNTRFGNDGSGKWKLAIPEVLLKSLIRPPLKAEKEELNEYLK